MDCSCCFLIHLNQWMTMTWSLSFLCWNPMYEIFVISLSILLHCPMVICVVSTIYIILKYWFQYLALLNLYLRDPSLERKASFFPKWFSLLPLGFNFYNLDTFWMLTDSAYENGGRSTATICFIIWSSTKGNRTFPRE